MPSNVGSGPPEGPETFYDALLVGPGPSRVALGPRAPPVHVSPAALYVASLTTARSRQTAIESLRRAIALLEAPRPSLKPYDWNTFPWEKVGPEQTTYLRAALTRPGGYKPATARLTISVVRGVLKQCFRQQLMDADTYTRATMIAPIKASSLKAGRMLSLEEIATLRMYIASLPQPYGLMVAAIFAAGLGGGLRREELTTLRADALDGNALRVMGKGLQEAMQSLPPWAADQIRTWSRERISLAGTPTLFFRVRWQGDTPRIVDEAPNVESTWRVIIETGRAAGIKKFTTHDLRRTYATDMIVSSDPVLAQQAMRHKNVATTMGYDRRSEGHVTDAIEKLKGWEPVKKVIDVEPKGLATIGDVLKAKGPTLSKLEDIPAANPPPSIGTEAEARAFEKKIKNAAPRTIPGAAVSPVRKDPQRRKIKVGDQELVEAPRGRIVRVRYRRNGVALDEHWATMQCQKLAASGKSHAVIHVALMKIGVTRADGSQLEIDDVQRLL